jgi:hypothetical protein
MIRATKLKRKRMQRVSNTVEPTLVYDDSMLEYSRGWSVDLKNELEICNKLKISASYKLLHNNCASISENLLKGIIQCKTIGGVIMPSACTGDIDFSLSEGEIKHREKIHKKDARAYFGKYDQSLEAKRAKLAAFQCCVEGHERVLGGNIQEGSEIIVYDHSDRDSMKAAITSGMMARDWSRFQNTMSGGHLGLCIRQSSQEHWATLGINASSKNSIKIASPDGASYLDLDSFRLIAWKKLSKESAEVLRELLNPNISKAFVHQLKIKNCNNSQGNFIQSILEKECPKGVECLVRGNDKDCQVTIKTSQEALKDEHLCQWLKDRESCETRPKTCSWLNELDSPICVPKTRDSLWPIVMTIFQNLRDFLSPPSSPPPSSPPPSSTIQKLESKSKRRRLS